jgi:hypothetical protein
MNKDEIMAMDGDQLCDWLNEHGVDFPEQDCLRTRWRDEIGVHEVLDEWNLPACAFAARDYCASKNRSYVWWIQVARITGVEKYPYETASPLDWLRAAAIVIAEKDDGE